MLDPDQFAALPPAEQQDLRAAMAEVEAELANLMTTLSAVEREHRRQVRELNRETVQATVGHEINEARAAFADLRDVAAYLDAVEKDLVERAEDFMEASAQAEHEAHSPRTATHPAFHRCEVNLIVDHSSERGAPVVFEDLPSQPNPAGRIEHLSQMGALVTDFTLIKSGSLHRANGGYLVIDIHRLLQQPFAWEELKRALRAGEIRLDGVPAAMPLLTTVSLEPEPIPLDVKVVLIGERPTLQLLAEVDPDLPALFKVQADFNDWIERTPVAELGYTRVLSTIARREGLRPLDAGAVAEVIDHAARLAQDARRLSTNIGNLAHIIREGDRYAAARKADTTVREDALAAIDGRRRRAARLGDNLRDAIDRGMLRLNSPRRLRGRPAPSFELSTFWI